MPGKYRHMLVTLLFLLAAVSSYYLGFSLGARLFFIAGSVFETVVWIRVLGKRYQQNQRLKTY